MREHPNKSARQVKNHFPIILKDVSERAIQKWRKMTDEKYNNLLKSNKKRERKAVPKFPTIEKEILRRREERVQKGRDRSVKWFQNETKKLLKDDEKLAELELNEFEIANLEKFHASVGWVNKVANRNDLKKKVKQSDRKMTMEEYVQLRIEYLKEEREVWVELGILELQDDDVEGSDGTLDKTRMANGDETPLVMTSKKRKQLSKKGERVQLISPPIVGDDKYRDATLVPFITPAGKLLFVCVLIRGGATITKNEIPIYTRKYGDILLIIANAKAYMYVRVFIFIVCYFDVMFRYCLVIVLLILARNKGIMMHGQSV